MTDFVFNDFNNASPDSDLGIFAAHAAESVEREINGKEITFLGDANHTAWKNLGFVFSRNMLAALARADVKHLMLEYENRSAQVFLDAVYEGQLTVPQYIATHMARRDDQQAMSDPSVYGVVAEGVLLAKKYGVRVHCVNGAEGMVDPENQKDFFQCLKAREESWLSYITTNKDFFDAPQKLLARLAPLYASTFGVSAEQLMQLSWLEKPVVQQCIHEFWMIEHGNDPFMQAEELISSRYRDMGILGDKAVETVIAERQSRDAEVMHYCHSLRQGKKAAIMYGAAHLRNAHGGFTSHLDPKTYSVIQLLCETERFKYPNILEVIQQHARPYDLSILTDHMRVGRFSDFTCVRPDGKMERVKGIEPS